MFEKALTWRGECGCGPADDEGVYVLFQGGGVKKGNCRAETGSSEWAQRSEERQSLRRKRP